MPKFRKTATIEAEQFHRGQPLPFAGQGIVDYDGYLDEFYVVDASGLRHNLLNGEWVVPEKDQVQYRGLAYVIIPSVFASTYEPV